MPSDYTKSTIKKIFVIQLIFALLGDALLCVFGAVAFSVINGSLICLLSNMLLYRFCLGTKSKNILSTTLTTFYLAQVVKFIFTIILFSFMLNLSIIKPVSLLLGYIVAQLCYWIAVGLSVRNNNE